MLQLNTKPVGLAGLAVGGTAIIGSVGALFKLLSSPAYLVSLYWALSHIKHGVATNNDALIIAQCVGGVIAIGGAFVIAILLAWIGMPSTVPTPPNGGNIVPLPASSFEDKKAA